jgi:hypothetical protein
MAKKLYWTIAVLTIGTLILILSQPEIKGNKNIIWITALIYTLFTASIHGILAHSLEPKYRKDLIIYPVLMGILFGILACIYLIIIMPQIC